MRTIKTYTSNITSMTVNELVMLTIFNAHPQTAMCRQMHFVHFVYPAEIDWFQVCEYGTGGHFSLHHDFFNLTDEGERQVSEVIRAIRVIQIVNNNT